MEIIKPNGYPVEQYLCMAFTTNTSRESFWYNNLHKIQLKKLYHMGIGLRYQVYIK